MDTKILEEVNLKNLSLKGVKLNYQSKWDKRTTVFTFFRRTFNDYRNSIGHVTHKMILGATEPLTVLV